MNKLRFFLIIISISLTSIVSAQWIGPNNGILHTYDLVGIGLSSPTPYTQLHTKYILTTPGTKYSSYNELIINTTYANAVIDNKNGFASSQATAANIQGVRGLLKDITKIGNSSSSYSSSLMGVYGALTLDDPLTSSNKTIGTYKIAAVEAQLKGNISNYPTNGYVAALCAEDQIKGSDTWAGYFDGNTFISDSMGIGTNNFDGYKLAVDGKIRAIEIKTDSLGIGTSNFDGYKLAVAGKIRATEVQVEALPWADFVFKKDYPLMSLNSLKEFIDENGHLPDIPNEQEVKEKGISLGEMDALLLQKIEELTLYVLELKQENEVLKERIDLLRTEKE